MPLIAASLLLLAIAPVKVTFTENLRSETMTQGDERSSETVSASEGKFSLRGEMTIPAGALGKAEALFVLQLGEYDFSAPIGDLFARGKAKLRVFDDKPEARVRPVLATAELTVQGSRLLFRIDKPAYRSLVAMTHKDDGEGVREGIAKGSVAIGGVSEEFTVSYRARVKRKTAFGPGLYGSVTTVDVKGG